MFGNHTYEEAVKIAEQKTRELGKQCVVAESEDEPGKFTVGVPVQATSFAEIRRLIRNGKP